MAPNDAQAVRLERRELYMLPTRHGVYFALAAITMLLAAVNYNNGLAYGFCFLLISTVLISMLYTHRNLEGLSISAGGAEPVFAGEKARFPVFLSNDSQRRRMTIWMRDDETPASFSLEPDEVIQRHVVTQTDHRGVINGPPVCLASHYPFGLLYTWTKSHTVNGRAVVYPRPAPSSPLPCGVDLESRDRASQTADGDDFVGLREFQEGDSPKQVHWALAARGQGIYTKIFGGEAGATIWLSWYDTDAADPEHRFSQLCRWLIDAEQEDLRYGLRLPTEKINPGSGFAHLRRCLTALATA